MIIDNLIAYDTETTGLNPITDKAFLHILHTKEKTDLYLEDEARYWKELHDLEKKVKELEKTEQTHSVKTRLQYRKNRLQKLIDYKPSFDMNECKDRLEDPKVPKVMHNAVFDILTAMQSGIIVDGDLFDTVINLHLINEREPKKLDYGSKKYCSTYKEGDKVNEWFKDRGIKKEDKRYDDVPLDIILPYGSKDGVATLELFYQTKPILENLDLWDLYIQECSLIKILVKARKRGFKADINYFQKLSPQYKTEIETIKQDIFRIAGEEFNIASSKQLGEFLTRQGVVLPKTGKGNISTKKDALKAVNHPAVDKILSFRKKEKIKSTFIDAIIKKNINSVVHASLNQCGTVSGRFSSNNPNMQNLPKKDPIIRNGFIAREGYINLYPDYKQMEYRMFADYIRDPWLTDQILQGADFHQITADAISSLGGNRDSAKAVNFGLVYGMGNETLAYKLGITVNEAADIIADYFGRFPKAELFINDVKARVKLRGYLTNRFGRRYHLYRSEAYMGVNRLCQGSSADVVKRSIYEVDKSLIPFDTTIIMMVHDELIIEVRKDQVAEVIKPITTAMETMPEGMFIIPFNIDMTYSETSWSEAKEWKI